MLWSAILFIWELVGIDLEKAKEAGGNAGALIGSIKSPQAIPWALLILIAYFLFKCSVEWYQCSKARRDLLVSKVDFVSAWVFPLLAYALYAYQGVRQVQLADRLQNTSIGLLPIIFPLLAWPIFQGIQRLRDARLRKRRPDVLALIDPHLFPLLPSALYYGRFRPYMGELA
jgi:hypothetical protein